MKLINQSVERKGDTVTIHGEFVNKWRRPVQIRVDEDTNTTYDVVMSGDVKETIETLNCLAQIAWNNGWRPTGFVEAIMATTVGHKSPMD